MTDHCIRRRCAARRHQWTASDVERSLWAAAASDRQPSRKSLTDKKLQPKAAALRQPAKVSKRKAANQGGPPGKGRSAAQKRPISS